MRIAQRLYEGIDVGEDGPTGLITYMRTDSTRLAPSALDMIRGYIHKNFEAEYLPPQPRFYTKGKGAQDAHEAVRPTNVSLSPKEIARYLDKEQLAVYTLIWTRTVASQMVDAKLERTRIEVPVGDYLFVATGSVIKFPGYLKIYEEARDEAGKTESESEGMEPVLNKDDERLPAVEEGDVFKVEDLAGKQHFTQPPPRFTEAGLIKELERQGIGRPSTYAAIISTIQDREYAEKEGGSFKPSELGVIVTELLTESFPQVLDVKFTARMEGQLDQVEEGKADWVQLLQDFYTPFVKRLETAQEQMRNLKAEQQPTEHVCEKCGSTMVVRWGRNGKFLACSGYPACRNTKPIKVLEDGTVEIVKDEETDEVCPNCSRPMVVKSGRRGRFLACSGYPECKTSKPLPIGVKCPRPGCHGDLVERQSGKGRTFYSCNAYPECRYLIGERPRKERCEVCNEEKFMAGKGVKQKAFGCTRAECPYESAWGTKEEETQNSPRRAPKKAAAKDDDDDKTAKKKAAPKKTTAKKAVKKKAAPKKTTAKKASPKKAAKKKAPAKKGVGSPTAAAKKTEPEE
jgi:DNA topoisomerase-1